MSSALPARPSPERCKVSPTSSIATARVRRHLRSRSPTARRRVRRMRSCAWRWTPELTTLCASSAPRQRRDRRKTPADVATRRRTARRGPVVGGAASRAARARERRLLRPTGGDGASIEEISTRRRSRREGGSLDRDAVIAALGHRRPKLKTRIPRPHRRRIRERTTDRR